jgi:hypothetical protein
MTNSLADLRIPDRGGQILEKRHPQESSATMMTVEAQNLDHLKLDNAPVISSPDRVIAYHPYELLKSGRVSVKMLKVSNNDGADLWLRAGDKRKNSISLHRRPVN